MPTHFLSVSFSGSGMYANVCGWLKDCKTTLDASFKTSRMKDAKWRRPFKDPSNRVCLQQGLMTWQSRYMQSSLKLEISWWSVVFYSHLTAMKIDIVFFFCIIMLELLYCYNIFLIYLVNPCNILSDRWSLLSS